MSELPPPEDGGAMAAHNNSVGSKRHRRPSVRLGDIGGDHSSRNPKSFLKDSSNKVSKNDHLTNLSSNLTLTLVDTNTNDNSNSKNKMKTWSDVDDEDIRDVNLDDVAIGSWKISSLKSSKKGTVTKKIRSGWGSKANNSEKHDNILSTTDVDDNENSGHSPVHSDDNNKINDNVNMGIHIYKGIGNVNRRKRATKVSDEGPTDTEARDWKCGSERNGVKVWLNQLGLGQYASLFEIHEVDDEVLPMLTLEDLKDMGINAVGSRRKMYCSIQNLNKGFS
ncbi:hypothetical protein RND71_017962 [Anisodus tanguticus]|uniref:SAM domain-containing protein n=1 Tax=Anisodus tanguticus TaxID=243964 RepID=A0AAE1S559_9SOLA|nr:hypothetical protein RND71_017962 [Anisodus tanguticus]